MNETAEEGPDSSEEDPEDSSEEHPEEEATAEADAADESFDRYQNSLYRLISMIGAGLIAILGGTGFAIGLTLSPKLPTSFFWLDGTITVVAFVWYALGMRCRLDVAETWIHVATKYGDFRYERDLVDSIEPDLSTWGALQWSGRPLIIRFRDEKTGKARKRRAYGCLPNDRQQQDVVIAELQKQLGSPDEVRAQRLAEGVAARLESTGPHDEDDTEAEAPRPG